MDFGGASVSGPRPYNEDNYLVQDLKEHKRSLGGITAFIMVSDGMGGHSSGDVASRVAIESAEAYIRDLIGMASQSQIKLDVPQALREIVEEAHNAVVRAAAEQNAASMGATLVAAFISDRKAWIGHAGDSRAYLLHDGEATQITTDHSQVGRMIAEGILTEEQAQSHPQRNVIDRALGFDGVEAEVNEVAIHSGDAIVLCSDGLSTVLSAADIAQITVSSDSADAAAKQLTEEALHAGTDDNTTAVIASDDWSLFRMSAPQLRESRTQASRKRREAARSQRASKKSLYVVGAVVVVGTLAIAAFALNARPQPGGGASGPAVVATETATVKKSESNTFPNAESAEDSGTQSDLRFIPNVEIAAKTYIRMEPSTDGTEVAQPVAKLLIRVDENGAQPDKNNRDTWYAIPRDALLAAGIPLLIDRAEVPLLVWVRDDRFEFTDAR